MGSSRTDEINGCELIQIAIILLMNRKLPFI
jgi:hypothetical protein